jgi:hypothetical protein
MQAILKKARETYGNKNQLMVCIEELNELACVLAKYPRYEDDGKATHELYDKALDEVADVYIVLEHIKAIFDITEEALWQRRSKKTARLNRWLHHSNSMVETTVDREVETTSARPCAKAIATDVEGKKSCLTCGNYPYTEEIYNSTCAHCLKAQATEGNLPFYTPKE